ncbi:hypothetical protein IJH16_00770 [Candidatus Saccharibacteria bacterium]|nr:hypothetical protein [Candidatus Saccharibacteria bacterium]
MELDSAMVGVNALYTCLKFDSIKMHLRSPEEEKELIKKGEPVTSYLRSVWERHVNLGQPRIKFISYEDEFMKILVGYKDTPEGGVRRIVTAIQVTPGDADNDGELVYCCRDEDGDEMMIEKNGWQKQLIGISNALSLLRQRFYPPKD